jgi:hypothetical protein
MTFDKYSFFGATIELSAPTLKLRTGGARVAWKEVKYIVSRSCGAYQSSRLPRPRMLTFRIAGSFQGLLGQFVILEMSILDDRFHESCHKGGIHLCLEAPIYGSVVLGRGVEGHGSVAAGDRVVARRCGFGEVEVDNAFENGTGKPGRAGADIAGVSRGSVVFCSGAQARTASSDGPALR